MIRRELNSISGGCPRINWGVSAYQLGGVPLPESFFIINRRVRGEGLNLVSIYRVYLLKLAITVDIEGQVFGRAGRSRQLAPVVTTSITYSTDR